MCEHDDVEYRDARTNALLYRSRSQPEPCACPDRQPPSKRLPSHLPLDQSTIDHRPSEIEDAPDDGECDWADGGHTKW